MKSIISSVDAKNNWGDTISRVQYGKERIAITKKGKAAVALVSIDDLSVLEQLEQLEDELDVQNAIAALNEAKVKGTVSWKDVKKQLGL